MWGPRASQAPASACKKHVEYLDGEECLGDGQDIWPSKVAECCKNEEISLLHKEEGQEK